MQIKLILMLIILAIRMMPKTNVLIAPLSLLATPFGDATEKVDFLPPLPDNQKTKVATLNLLNYQYVPQYNIFDSNFTP